MKRTIKYSLTVAFLALFAYPAHAIYKNTASQKLPVFAWDTSADAPTTGAAAYITARISLNGAAMTALTDTNPAELDATYAPGVYVFDLATTETNANMFTLYSKCSTSTILLEPITVFTREAERGTDSAALAATALSTDQWTNARSAYLDKLNVAGTLAHSEAAATYKATGFSTHSAADVATAILTTSTNKLSTYPDGSVNASRLAGELVVAGDAPPTSATIADAVLGELVADHTVAGSLGKTIADIPTAAEIETEILEAIIDGTVNLATALKRILSVTANSVAITIGDPNIMEYKNSLNDTTVTTHSIPQNGTSRTATFE